MAASPEKEEGLRKFCTHCKWLAVEQHPILKEREMLAVCTNPKQGVSLIDGSVKHQEVRIHRMMRSLPTYCGTIARWWESKTDPT